MYTNYFEYFPQRLTSYPQINGAYDQSVSKINTKPILIEGKQFDKKKIESNRLFGDNKGVAEFF